MNTFYSISHNHRFGISNYFLELDCRLPLHTSFFDGSEDDADENRLLDSLLDHLGIDFEPDRDETLEFVEVVDDAIHRLKVEDLNIGAPEVPAYPDLYNLAGDFDHDWEENEGVDWDQAEALVSELKKMAPEHRALLPKLLDIIKYTDAEDEWDSGEVASFPATIIFELDDSEKHYSYRPEGEKWVVFGMNMTGIEEWVATVDTETVARRLTFSL
jgi:hypothetical protein